MARLKSSQRVTKLIPRQKQSIEPHRQDPYRETRKSPDTPLCPSCNAVFFRGKWISAKQAKARIVATPSTGSICPACRQLKERYAMGVVELHGDKWKAQSSQIFQTIEKTEKIERSRNDQERILWSRTLRGVTKIYVTLPELARHIGRELQKSFHGKVEYHRSSEEPYLRVVWRP